MKCKVVLVLLFVFFNMRSYSQEEDYVKDTSLVLTDTLYSDDAKQEVTETDKKDTSTFVFKNNEFDTAKIDVRYNTTDSLNYYKNLEDFKYLIPKEEKVVNNSSPRNNIKFDFSFLEWLIWIVIIVVVISVVYFFVKENNVSFKRNKKIIEDNSDYDLDNIHENDYSKLIAEAENNQNYNLASRLGFLQLLAKLDNRKAIDYKPEKTNFDYKFNLMGTKFYEGFTSAAFCFEYAWYSGIIVSSNQYQQIKQEYKKLDYLL